MSRSDAMTLPLRISRFALQCGTAAIVASLAVPACLPAPAWLLYENDRFGFSIDIPARGFTPDAPPANGDGQRWVSQTDAGTITVYGAFLVVVPSFADYQDWLIEQARSEGIKITYRAKGNGWFVYSGKGHGRILYERVVSACEGEIAVSVRFDYPASGKASWDPIVAHVAPSLKAGPPDACP